MKNILKIFGLLMITITSYAQVTVTMSNMTYNSQAIISGTFWYDAINSTGQKVEVRNGRFDMHF